MSENHSIKPYCIVFGLLLVLTGITVIAAYINFGALGFPIAMLIASSKAALVVLYFMHIHESPAFLKLLVIATILWMVILLSLTFQDYVTRKWDPQLSLNSWITRDANHYSNRGPHTF